MANFALINKEKVVIHVSCVDNGKLLDEKGQEQEAIGIEYLEKVHKGKTKWPKTFDDKGNVTECYSDDELQWVQTSYNAKGGEGFRKNYAGKGYTWNEEIEGFVPPKPPEPEAKDVEEAGQYVLNEEKAIYEFSGKLISLEIKK